MTTKTYAAAIYLNNSTYILLCRARFAAVDSNDDDVFASPVRAYAFHDNRWHSTCEFEKKEIRFTIGARSYKNNASETGGRKKKKMNERKQHRLVSGMLRVAVAKYESNPFTRAFWRKSALLLSTR